MYVVLSAIEKDISIVDIMPYAKVFFHSQSFKAIVIFLQVGAHLLIYETSESFLSILALTSV